LLADTLPLVLGLRAEYRQRRQGTLHGSFRLAFRMETGAELRSSLPSERVFAALFVADPDGFFNPR
jgi:hypothetical protein